MGRRRGCEINTCAVCGTETEYKTCSKDCRKELMTDYKGGDSRYRHRARGKAAACPTPKKVRYADKQAADEAIVRLYPESKMHSYRCKCKSFHIGHPHARRTDC